MQIDLVNDVSTHYGRYKYDSVLGKIDSWRNILSNKITALFRSEPKDVIDIWALSKYKRFPWKTIIGEAKSKEAGVEPEVVYDILMSFPVDTIEEIKWINNPPEKGLLGTEIKTIADDILFGRNNSLYR